MSAKVDRSENVFLRQCRAEAIFWQHRSTVLYDAAYTLRSYGIMPEQVEHWQRLAANASRRARENLFAII